MFHHGRPRTEDRAAAFFVYTGSRPLRPELCHQYRDDTFARPAPPGNVDGHYERPTSFQA